jgi:hypothetical protein
MRGADAAWPGIQSFLKKHNLFPENFTLPDLNLPGIFPEKKAGGANGG